jgi:uncharacterized protein
MQDKLRRSYHVQKEVARNGCFEGEIGLAELDRLAQLSHAQIPHGQIPHAQKGESNPGTIKLKFEFGRNELDAPMIVGQFDTSLTLECQRCLKAMDKPMIIDFRLLIDASDELVQESNLDTLHSDDGYIDIVAVVEDEIMLELPLVALHEDGSCNKHWQASESETEEAVRDNPFSVLKQLKTTD